MPTYLNGYPLKPFGEYYSNETMRFGIKIIRSHRKWSGIFNYYHMCATLVFVAAILILANVIISQTPYPPMSANVINGHSNYLLET